MTDKRKMQADGGGSKSRPDAVEDTPGAGESGGGAYPNPHSGNGHPDEGFLGHGGQSEIAYHGPGQLGDEQVDEDANANSATRSG